MSDAVPNAGHFAPGRSGNLRGRPKRSTSVDSEILKAMQEVVTVQKNGRPKRISKLAATVTQFANRGAAGDHRSGKTALDLAIRAEERSQATTRLVVLTATDAEIAARLVARIRMIITGEVS